MHKGRLDISWYRGNKSATLGDMLRAPSALIRLPSYTLCLFSEVARSILDIIIAVDAELRHRLPPRAALSNPGIIIIIIIIIILEDFKPSPFE